MNIIHFSKSDDKGAFLAAYRFHQQLLSYGYNSVMIVAKKNRKDENIIEVKLSFLQHLYMKIVKGVLGFLIKYKTLPQYYFFNYYEKVSYPYKAILKSLPFNPDIIINHWVTGFVNSKILHQLHNDYKSKIFWQFNDMNAFTGGCHYSNGCTRYVDECNFCPALVSKKHKDHAHKNYLEKLKWLAKTDITFVSTTTEIHQQLISSTIAKVCKTKLVMLCVNDQIFKPATNKKAIIKDLNLPTDKKIIFFGAQNIKDIRKGFNQLMEILHILKKMLSLSEANDVLLVYASLLEHDDIIWPFETIKLPFVASELVLAKMYQAATVFLSTSIEDAGPMSIAEAISCGAPTISFNIGLANDIIIDNITGFVVPLFDCHTFAKRIKDILQLDGEAYNLFSQQCRTKANSILSINKNMTEYKLLFDR